MPDFVKTATRLVAAILLLPFAAASGAAANADTASGEDRELERFVPSIALISGLDAQNVEGHIGTSNIVGPPFSTVPPPPFMIPPPPPQVSQVPAQPLLQGSPATSRTLMMTPSVGVSLELMTPAWKSLPLSPRLHAHADVSASFAPEYVIPSIGDVGPITVVGTTGGLTEGRILGQGGDLTASVTPLLVNAGAGVTLTTTPWHRTVRIKASLEYLREEIEVSGIVQRAVRNSQAVPNLTAFRIITLTASGRWVYQGLGPGLEIELDTGRAGPFVITLFGSGKAWAFLDNPKRVLVASNQYGEHAEFTFLKNDWAFGGTLGFRFRWVPR